MRKRVLLIEDESFVARAFSRYLEEHDVRVAATGREALRVLAEDSPFDAIICDLSMPDMDGVMVYQAVLQSHPGLERRIVFCSGGAQSPRARELLERTKLPLVEKPLSGAALRAAVLAAMAPKP